MKTTENGVDYSSLSLKELIEARDLYHSHLMGKATVVGTAIGSTSCAILKPQRSPT